MLQNLRIAPTSRYRCENFQTFFLQKRDFVPIFRKIPKFLKILRSNFIARIDTGTSGISRTSQEIPRNPNMKAEIIVFGKFLILYYYILLLRQNVSLPLHFDTVAGLTARKATVSRGRCIAKNSANISNIARETYESIIQFCKMV